MAIDPSIALQVQAPSLGMLGTGFQQGLQSAESMGKLSDENRIRNGQAALRGVLGQVDPSDPNYLDKVQSQLQQQGFGDVAQDFVAKARQGQATLAQTKALTNQNQTQRLKELTDFRNGAISAAASLAQQAKTPEERAAIKDHLVQQIQGLKATNPDIAQSAPEEFDTSELEAHDFNDVKSLKPYTYLGLPAADRIKQTRADAFFENMGGLGPDHLQNIETLQKNAPALLIADPEQQKTVDAMLNNEKAAAFKELKPKLDAIVAVPPGGYNPLNGSKAIALSKANALVPSALLDSPQYKEWLTGAKGETPNAQVSVGSLSTVPPKQSTIDNAIKRIANGESTVAEEMNKGFGRASAEMASDVHDQLVEGVKKINPNFSEAESESGFAFSKNPATKRSLANIENAYSTVDHIRDVYSKLNNTQFPTLNKAILAGKIQTGDIQAAKAQIDQILASDELSKAYVQSGGSTDMLRGMSNALGNPNGAPAQQTAQFEEILSGLDRFHKAYESQGGGYIKPFKGIKSSSSDNSEFKNDPTYSSIEEALQKAPANATGAWINGVHHSFQSK